MPEMLEVMVSTETRPSPDVCDLQKPVLEQAKGQGVGDKEGGKKRKRTWQSKTVKCYQCGHEWVLMKGKLPRECSWCKSRHWNDSDYKPLTITFPCGHTTVMKRDNPPVYCPTCLKIQFRACDERKELRCQRCNYGWKSKINTRPGHCPSCGSGEWDIPKPLKRRSPPHKQSRYTIEHFQEYARQHGGVCLSTEYHHHKDKIKYRCAEGHEWTINAMAFNQGAWCRKCMNTTKYLKKHGIYLNGESILKQRLKDLQKFVNGMGGECLSTEYVNSNTRMQFRCKRGHTWWAKPVAIMTIGNWCPNCGVYREDDARKTLQRLYGVDFPKCHPKWLRNPKTNRPLELDGYNEKLGIAMEYQGPQHYGKIYKNYGGEPFTNIKYRDSVKVKLCRERGVTLIVVPYNTNDFEKYIKSYYPDIRMIY